MATFTTSRQSVQSFPSQTGTNTVVFLRPVNTIFLTTTGTVNVSWDGGTRFMNIPAGTHQFYHLGLQKELSFTGGGTVEGCGFAL